MSSINQNTIGSYPAVFDSNHTKSLDGLLTPLPEVYSCPPDLTPLWSSRLIRLILVKHVQTSDVSDRERSRSTKGEADDVDQQDILSFIALRPNDVDSIYKTLTPLLFTPSSPSSLPLPPHDSHTSRLTALHTHHTHTCYCYHTSTTSTTCSPAMPAYVFPRQPTPTPHIPSLLEFLSTDPPLPDLVNALQEFAWRAITDGRRVRKWCAEITALIESVSHPTSCLTKSSTEVSGPY